MHEAGLSHAAVNAVIEAAGDRTVVSVRLAIGPGVEKDAAAQAWVHCAEGTTAAQAVVTWEQARDSLACLECGDEYPGDRLTCCPVCGANGLVVAPASEIEIVDWAAGP